MVVRSGLWSKESIDSRLVILTLHGPLFHVIQAIPYPIDVPLAQIVLIVPGLIPLDQLSAIGGQGRLLSVYIEELMGQTTGHGIGVSSEEIIGWFLGAGNRDQQHGCQDTEWSLHDNPDHDNPDSGIQMTEKKNCNSRRGHQEGGVQTEWAIRTIYGFYRQAPPLLHSGRSDLAFMGHSIVPDCGRLGSL